MDGHAGDQLSYKYREHLPAHLMAELDDAARIADELDHRMGRLRDEIRHLDADVQDPRDC